MIYFQQSFRLEAGLEDLLVAELLVLGTLGCESTFPDQAGQILLKGLFDADPSDFSFDDFCREHAIVNLGFERVPEKDWLAEYRATVQPFDLGERFHIDPRDPDDHAVETASNGRHLLRIPAQTAFGTGSHESTRLALAWLETTPLDGKSVLDVGTGSGILCFAAEKLGATFLVGYDIDPEAIWIARQNAQRNACGSIFLTTRAAAFKAGPIFDLLVINELPERILADYPALLQLLTAQGRVISSGNLLDRRDELIERFAELGLEPRGERVEGEWISFLLTRR